MLRVLAEQGKAIVRQPLDLGGQGMITGPESRRSAVFHSDVQRPSRPSRKASSANVSNRPSATSCSN
jgi:hypothetical protein